MCVNDRLMQTQADFLNVPVERPANVETTALGAAIAAGITSFSTVQYSTVQCRASVNAQADAV